MDSNESPPPGPRSGHQTSKIEEIDQAENVYARWIEGVCSEAKRQDVFVTFSPRFKRIWMPAKKRMPDQRALDTAIPDINKRTELHVEIESLEKEGTRVTALPFLIKAQKLCRRHRTPLLLKVPKTKNGMTQPEKTKGEKFGRHDGL
jgi:hypothetical protein